jgi:hypothetical protein
MKLRFSIRDLLWLTLVVALIVGWWLQYRRSKRYTVTFPGSGVLQIFDEHRRYAITMEKPEGFGPVEEMDVMRRPAEER